MAANAQVQRQSIFASKPSVTLPKFPEIFCSLKRRLPDQRVAIETTEKELIDWVNHAQLAINRALTVDRREPGLVIQPPTGISPEVALALQNLSNQITALINSIPAPVVPPVQSAGNYYGVGDPNSVVTAGRGSSYQEFSAGYAQFLRTWIKNSDASLNTGWV